MCATSAVRAALLVADAVRCAYIRGVDEASFLLMRYFHSPGATRSSQLDYSSIRNRRSQTQYKKIEDTGNFVRFWNPIFGS